MRLNRVARTCFNDSLPFSALGDGLGLLFVCLVGRDYEQRNEPRRDVAASADEVGLAITAGTYATLGMGAPARAGFTLLKVGRRSGRLNPALVTRIARDALKVEEAGGLFDLVGNVGRVESKAGAGAALDSLKVAEGPEDVSRFARLATAKGSKTRAIIKLLGRGAIMFAANALEMATWLLWAAFLLFGFASSCKAATERTTLHYIRWRKARFMQRSAMPQTEMMERAS
jgi:hypothetical protein